MIDGKCLGQFFFFISQFSIGSLPVVVVVATAAASAPMLLLLIQLLLMLSRFYITRKNRFSFFWSICAWDVVVVVMKRKISAYLFFWILDCGGNVQVTTLNIGSGTYVSGCILLEALSYSNRFICDTSKEEDEENDDDRKRE